jgi:hypothetical protein
VIRRREETAATRSRLNTAKVMEDILWRLKELGRWKGDREDRQDLGVRRPGRRAEGSGEDQALRSPVWKCSGRAFFAWLAAAV